MKSNSPLPNDPGAFRVPPQDLEAEESVLGAMLLSEEAAFKVFGILKEGDFYREAHRKIFRGVAELNGRREPVDVRTITNQLKKMGEFENVGGIPTLTALLERVPTAANAEYYARIVKEKAKGRRIIEICGQALADAYSDEKNPLEIQDSLVEELLREEGSKSILEPVSFAGIVYNENTAEKKIDYIPTGYAELDGKLKGIRLGALGTITGPFENGKSSFMQNISVHVAKYFKKQKEQQKFKVLHIALEDTAKNILQRQICLMNGWPIDNLKSNDPKIQDFGKKAWGYGAWADLGIRLGDKRNLGKKWDTIKVFILREIKNQNVKVIFIEGAERMSCQPIYGENKYDAQERMVDELDDITQEHNVAIWAIVGQSKPSKEKGAPKNEMEGGTAAWPKISRQRLFVERHPRYESDDFYKNISIVKITKNSDGHRGNVWFEGERDSYRWKEFERTAEHESKEEV